MVGWLDGWCLDGWSLDVVNRGRLDKDYCQSNENFFATEGSKKIFFLPLTKVGRHAIMPS